MKGMRSTIGCGRVAWSVALAIVTQAACWSQAVGAGNEPYPTMAPLSQYLIASRAEEIGLAKSAAPAAVADHAEVLVLGAHGYETAVKGTNGFVCFRRPPLSATSTAPWISGVIEKLESDLPPLLDKA